MLQSPSSAEVSQSLKNSVFTAKHVQHNWVKQPRLNLLFERPW